MSLQREWSCSTEKEETQEVKILTLHGVPSAPVSLTSLSELKLNFSKKSLEIPRAITLILIKWCYGCYGDKWVACTLWPITLWLRLSRVAMANNILLNFTKGGVQEVIVVVCWLCNMKDETCSVLCLKIGEVSNKPNGLTEANLKYWSAPKVKLKLTQR